MFLGLKKAEDGHAAPVDEPQRLPRKPRFDHFTAELDQHGGGAHAHDVLGVDQKGDPLAGPDGVPAVLSGRGLSRAVVVGSQTSTLAPSAAFRTEPEGQAGHCRRRGTLTLRFALEELRRSPNIQ